MKIVSVEEMNLSLLPLPLTLEEKIRRLRGNLSEWRSGFAMPTLSNHKKWSVVVIFHETTLAATHAALIAVCAIGDGHSRVRWSRASLTSGLSGR